MKDDIIYISGFWKDDKVKFTDYKVTEIDDVYGDDDDSIFYYGLTEMEIKHAILFKWNTEYEFVITSYHR